MKSMDHLEVAALLGMALSNLSLEQKLDPLRETIPAIQHWLVTGKNAPPLNEWLQELQLKVGPLPSPLIPGGDQAAAILYLASAKATPPTLKAYLSFLAHFINEVTFLKEPN